MAKTTDFTNFANERPNYFAGQYLLEDDFEIQHKYLSDRQRYQNQILHVSGIIEGLEVEVIKDKKAVLIKSGSAINSNGELIVLKKDITFSDFKNITNGELYIQYSQEQQVKQQEDVTDSYTRWIENPILGFTSTTPENSIKLAKLTISQDTFTLDFNVREYSGLSLPNSNSKALTIRSGGNANSNSAVLTGSLKIDGNLIVNGTGSSDFAGDLTINGKAKLGYASNISDFGSLLVSGFYENGGKEIVGDVPDISHVWTHLITARHSNKNNNHQLQIAASYKSNDRLFFRKIEATGVSNPSWNEVATRGTNVFDGAQTINGSLKVTETIYVGGNPIIYENYEIYLRGSSFESAEGNNTFLKIANISISITNSRGINTVILNPNGTLKKNTTHDVWASANNWNSWADWINTNATTGDVIAVASYDALNNAPTGGSAETLLRSINAWGAFQAVQSNQRSSYTLLFIQGQSRCIEVSQPYKGLNAHLKTTYYQLLTLQNLPQQEQWQTPTLQNSWVNYENTYNSAGYFKDTLGIVHLKGLIRSGTTNSTIFTLPVGYRPSNRELQAVQTHENTIGRVDILTDGKVQVVFGNSGWVSLDGITFRAKE